MQPYKKKASSPAGHLQSPLAAPNPLLLLCAEPPLRSKGYGQISTSLNGENVIHCAPKHLWSWFCSALLGLSGKLLQKLQWGDPDTRCSPSCSITPLLRRTGGEKMKWKRSC